MLTSEKFCINAHRQIVRRGYPGLRLARLWLAALTQGWANVATLWLDYRVDGGHLFKDSCSAKYLTGSSLLYLASFSPTPLIAA